MTENVAPTPDVATCPWCSAELPPEAVETCTWCGAKLTGDAEAPGLTSLDQDAISRAVRDPIPQRRSRLMSWITGDDGTSMEAPAAPGSLDPPPPEVRREMLRLQLEAEAAELAAEASTLAADAREAGDEEGEQVLEAAAEDAAELRTVLASEPDTEARVPGEGGDVGVAGDAARDPDGQYEREQRPEPAADQVCPAP
jgi:hypothetical protein